MSDDQARYGWGSDFPRFRDTPKREIRSALEGLVHDASPEQIRAWDASIPQLQREVAELLSADQTAAQHTAILEYELPMESRRPDAVFLVGGAVAVVELKGKTHPSPADLDQAAAYARDLRFYHRECAGRRVEAALVPTRSQGYLGYRDGVHVLGPDTLDSFLQSIGAGSSEPPISRDAFLAAQAYSPLPTLVQAARELFEKGDLRRIHQACANTDPTVSDITAIIHEAARTRTRRLVLLTGVPGAGKTLVGLRIAHAHFLDDLAVARSGEKPTVPAVFLSGNAPLVQVLQYQLKEAGGDGKTFVRGVKDYVKRYSGRRSQVPPEHVLVFDEAQRAYDAEEVREKHKNTRGFEGGKSEPEHFIEFADRVPEWCVVIGLIGTGQEIHIGEEAGVGQWRTAVEGSKQAGDWKVHGPDGLENVFSGSSVPYEVSKSLNLDHELRFHAASNLHRFVSSLLSGGTPSESARVAEQLDRDGYRLRITRDLADAKQYFRERYAENRDARFGVLASSRDRDLPRFGIDNGFNATGRFNFGPWYGDAEDEHGGRSCRRLDQCVTEFGAQGLELDAALLAWGTDLVWQGAAWSSENAKRYKRASRVRDGHQLRVNAYRVLLTRGRDGTVVFVPPIGELDVTFDHLCSSGFRVL